MITLITNRKLHGGVMYQWRWSRMICPKLKGSFEGAICLNAREYIQHIEDAKIEICISNRFETCCIYSSSLKPDCEPAACNRNLTGQ